MTTTHDSPPGAMKSPNFQSRFQLLDQQYTNDLKRLIAIKESGQFFVLREPSPCPLCGALPEGQRHDSACDGNVAAVTQSAAAEITKIKLLQTELQDTVVAITKEHTSILVERRTLEDSTDESTSSRSTQLCRQNLAKRGKHTRS